MSGVSLGGGSSPLKYTSGGADQPVDIQNPLPVIIGDGEDTASVNKDKSLNVSSFDTFSLLNKVLKELKIMNIHLSLLTDNEIKKTEVD